MWFLPLNTLPGFITGPLMSLCGVVLVIRSEPLSWGQVEGGTLAIVGILMAVASLRKVASQMEKSAADGVLPTRNRLASLDEKPDFSRCTGEELASILRHINREKYPERVCEIEQLLERLAGGDKT